MDTIVLLKKEGLDFAEWKHHRSWYNKSKAAYRNCAETHRKKGKHYQQRIRVAVKGYLAKAEQVRKRLEQSLQQGWTAMKQGSLSLQAAKLLGHLQDFYQLMVKHMDLLHRRLILGEKIPHQEKVFSIFEPHVEWLDKGKANRKVDLGHNVLIATDQYHFILHHEVMQGVVDKQLSLSVGRQIKAQYPTTSGYIHKSISYDRGFYSGLAKKELSTQYKIVVMPKPGTKSLAQQQQETQADYQQHRRAHNGVEANIHQLQHHGLSRCRDKGIEGFRRCVAYSVLSYNMHQLGRLLLRLERERAERLSKAA